ncbi:MAG: class I SAM-dependent methyltransferase [Solirubrobacterales bacterium]
MIEANVDQEALDNLAFASRKPPELMHHRLVECPVCDLLYASPAPAPEQLHGAYESAGYDSGDEARFASHTYARSLHRFISEIPDRGGAIDIGAGDGAFLHDLLEAGFDPGEVVGIEPSEAPIAAAQPDVRALIRPGTFSAADFEPGAFRLVTSFQTLEHVHDPAALCEGAHRILAPGGALMVVCHDRRSIINRLLGRRSPIFDVQHMQLFSPRSLRTLIEDAGFERVRLRHIVNRYPLRYWLRLAPLPSALKQRLTRPGRLGFPVSLPVGNVLAVGFKPAEKDSGPRTGTARIGPA